MTKIVKKALALWKLSGADYVLIAARENAVYKVTCGHQSFALRLHRRGYRSDAELWSELQWMDAMSIGGLKVPTPMQSVSGHLLHLVDGIQVDVLTWLSGKTLDEMLKTLGATDRAAQFLRLGQNMARLHDLSDAWQRPAGFTRCAWSRDGMLGENPLWDRFWDNPALTLDERSLFSTLREKANSELVEAEDRLDYGLIHADLVGVNIMADGNDIRLIDFDDGGFGFRLFEIATALLKNLGASDYLSLKSALIEGYTSVRPIDLAKLDLFILLRSATYVGWNIARMGEDGAVDRNKRFIKTTKQLASVYVTS